MGKYRRYKNRIEMFLSSENGKRTLNFVYSWGASIVIIGALFKILHLQYGNEILTVAMIVEAIVFFVSGFERPANEYHWEEVFPVLKSKNPLDRPDFSSGGAGNGEGQVIIGGSGGHLGGGTIVLGDLSGAQSGGGALTGNARAAAQNAELGMAAMGLNVSEEDTKNLANSIQKLGDAAEQISRMADLTDATKTYIEQISSVTANLERFNVVTNSLSEVSDSLVHSCEMIAGSKNEHSEKQTIGYVQQMEQLNQSLSGLNEFYSVHLSGLRSQMDTIQQINAGLSRIRDMYDNSVMDSTAFRNENERMAQLLAQLNQVYGRLLQAMTVNMPGGATMYPPQQPPYQGGYPPQGYAQQPPYPNQR
ncbi:gliding motility protein GldL [Tannerella forsythia]|uniref:Gliding motility protein GldL n=1 Tax=Tannerella forsythia TaxID=28112 RepID=A0A3P1Z5K1_TANFO|nr:gliding motility protein GldL [Tannerella forsythia]RRD59282.1 gliding motility protein GldL [Tannerella forsythia]RRD77350.1 gliding motility protein GldL [Tannerella forsythia]